MTSYKKELRGKAKSKNLEILTIMSHSKLSDLDREEIARLSREIRELDGVVAGLKVPDTRGMKPGKGTEEDRAFTRYLHSGDSTGLRMGAEARSDGTGMSSFPNDVGLSAGSPTAGGGYLVPQGFWKNLQVALKAYGGMAFDFKQINTDTGNPTPWPAIDPTSVTAGILSGELNQLSVVDPYVFGQGMLNAWTLFVGPVLASLQLVADSAFDIDGFIADRFGEALGREIAALAVSGTGSGQPLGIIPSLGARGQVTTSGGYYQLGYATPVNTLAGLTNELAGNLLSPQTLLNMIKSIDPAYRAMGAAFYVNDAQLMGLRTVTDEYGRPLLQDPAKESGNPTLWGYPVKVDNLIPNLSASATGGPVFGCLKNAMVMRTVRTGTTVMRLTERYADFLAVGYIGYYRMDIRSNDLRAAVTVKSSTE